MIPKKYKLTGKDIQYILNKKKFQPGKDFSCFLVPQYKQYSYHQIGYHIPTQWAKSAVERNFFKRIFYRMSLSYLVPKKNQLHRYKCFIVRNKKTIPIIEQLLASGDKNTIISTLERMLQDSLSSLFHKLGKT